MVQAVSAAFKAAAVASNIVATRLIVLSLVDNTSIGASITPAGATTDATNFPASKATNGVNTNDRKWAWADQFNEGSGGRVLADGSWYPYVVGYEGGWWGATLSDNSGNIGGGGEVFTITYATPVTLQQVAFWADANLSIPVNFVVSYDPTGSAGFTTITTVTGNALANWIYNLPAPISCKILKITITKINQNKFYTTLIEFQGGLVIDVTSQFHRWTVLTERYPDNASLSFGAASAGEISLDLDNTLGLWSPHNASSPYAPYLRANRKLQVSVGFQYSNGTTDIVPFGTFYSMVWSAANAGPVASLKGQDRMKKLRERKYRNCALQVNKTVDACIKQACLDFGLGVNEYTLATSSTVIPYAWATTAQTFFDYLSQLAAADGGVVFFDENDVLHFQDANYLNQTASSNVFQFTDNNALISGLDAWDEAQIKNRVVVTVNALQVAALAQIWALQETLTVKANSTLTVNVTFQNPATGVTTPVITAGADIVIQSWTAYAYGGVLVLKNNHVSNNETVTACTIQGQSITANGANIVTAETASVTSGFEPPRELTVNNQFIQITSMANALAGNLLTLYNDPPPQLTVKSVGLPHIELGDRVNVYSQQMGINADFYVVRHLFGDDGGLASDFNLVSAPLLLPTRATLWHDESTVLTGGALTVDFDGNQLYLGAFFQNPSNPGDSFTQSFVLRAGAYKFSVLGIGTSSSPIVAWFLDGTQVIGGQDWYRASNTFGLVQTSSITVPTDGYHVLKGLITGLNPLSVSAVFYITKMWFTPVSD